MAVKTTATDEQPPWRARRCRAERGGVVPPTTTLASSVHALMSPLPVQHIGSLERICQIAELELPPVISLISSDLCRSSVGTLILLYFTLSMSRPDSSGGGASDVR